MKQLVTVSLVLFIFAGVIMAGAGVALLPAGVAHAQDSEIERAALMRLYESTGGDFWVENAGWGGPDSYCAWFGVTCDSANHVLALDLSGNLLEGPIPAQIEDLAALQRLDLSSNTLTGSVPDALGSLAQLRFLDLSYSLFCAKACYRTLGGAIPESLGKLANLQTLNLSHNAFAGAVPAGLGDLAQLQTLDLSENYACVTSYIPEEIVTCRGGLLGSIPASLSRLPALQTLRLQGNRSLCWETRAARAWALSLPLYTGPTDCAFMPLMRGGQQSTANSSFQ